MMINNRRHSFDADKTRDDYQQVQQVNWSFPLMKMADIKECLNALDMKVTEAQLADVSQNKQLYRDILEYMAEICTGITKEEISQPQFNGLQSLNNPELHEESIPYLHAFRAVAKMMKISGITDFSIKDYLQPSAKRLRRQLSGIINFAKFREERFALLQDVSSERERLVSALNSRKSVKEAVEKKLAMLKER
jgi:kinetochore protein Nuf2